MENRTITLNPHQPETFPAIHALAERCNELTGQLEILMVVFGSALKADPGVASVLLAAIDGARKMGHDSALLSAVEAGLTIENPEPPKGGKFLRVVGGTEGPEAKAA